MDPAGSYDNGSFQIMNQVYPFLMNFVPGSGELRPDIAQNCRFSAPDRLHLHAEAGSEVRQRP